MRGKKAGPVGEESLPEAGAVGRTVAFPPERSVPEWSDETLALFEELTPLERAWVEWFASCNNAIQAYRLATGRADDEDVSRNSGWQIKCRPRVKAAVAAAFKDRSAAPLMDRGYKLTVLREQIEQARRSADPRARANIPKLVELAAKLQGEIVQRSEVEHRGDGQSVNVNVRVNAVLAEVAQLIAGRTGRPPVGIGRAGAVADRAGGDDPVGAE